VTEVRGAPIAAEELARQLRDGHWLAYLSRSVGRGIQPRKLRKDFERLTDAYQAWLDAGREEEGS
jgi:hypothetical protein